LVAVRKVPLLIVPSFSRFAPSDREELVPGADARALALDEQLEVGPS
jgi:hypothetical protein